MKKLMLIVSGILGLGLSSLGIVNHKQPEKVSGEFAPEGMVAYAASYTDDPADEPKYSTQNSKTFQYLNLGKTHDYYRGDSVKVGIIDSGINYDHEDFMVNSSSKVKGDSKYYAYQTSSWVYYKASQHGYSYIDDTLGHGTNVAATVAAAVNSIGGTGLAPNVELYVYKVTNSSNGYEFGAIQNALMDAQTLGIDVINMSFQSYEHQVTYGSSTMGASSGCSTILSYYLNQAYNAGITLVGAAGNYNTDEPSYPGSNSHVINVGSLNQTGTDKAGFSNYGSTIDLVAPGYVHVADEASNSAYTDTSGTSFSAPLVTAAIALYKQQNPSATPSQIETALYASCDPIDDSGSEYTNWAGNGALNVAKFLGCDEEEAGPTEIIINNPEVVNEELSLEVGDHFDIDWTVNGVGTFDNSVSFSTLEGRDDILTVDSSGRITAVGEGEEYVVIQSNANSNVYASIYVTVTSSSGGSQEETTGDYMIGWGTASGTAGTYSNFTAISGSVSDILSFTSSKNSAGSDPAYNGSNNELRLYYASSGNGGSITITPAEDVTFTGFEMKTSTLPAVKYSVDGGSLVSVTGSSNTYTVEGISASSSLVIQNANTTNTQLRIKTIKISYSVSTVSKTLSSISLSEYKTAFIEGDNFSFDGTVTAHFSDSSTDVVTSESTFSGYDMTIVGNQTITVSYTFKGIEVTNTYQITVSQGTLSSISVSGMTTQYQKNASFNFNGTCTATFVNGYQKTVTPTSVSSPDMSSTGNKTITVSYTYNGNTASTTYSINVSSNRTVIEVETSSINSTITWPTSSTATITGDLLSVSCTASGKTVYESSSIRLGTGNGGGTLSIYSGSTITKVDVVAKYYTGYSSAILKVNGTSVSSLSSSYSTHTVNISPGKTSFTVLTENSNSRINVQSIKLYSETTIENDISSSEDCVGLETFIDSYLHMNYVENLGYCKDSEHHYYSTARDEFNKLNDHQRILFTSNSAYNTEWTRLSTWATINGESLNSNNKLSASRANLEPLHGEKQSAVVIIIVAITSTASIGVLLVIKKKRSLR